MNLYVAYPWWFILLCLITAGVYSLILYYKNKKDEWSKKWLYTLSAIRFVLVFLTAFLLLSPVIKTTKKRIEKPIIVIAQDNSESLVLNPKGHALPGDWNNQVKRLQERLSSRFLVRVFSFGASVQEQNNFNYQDKKTNFSMLFDELKNRLENRNVGAVILMSDGLYNSGENPLYAYNGLPYPLYTVALGDTVQHKDVLIRKVHANQYTYLGNQFPLSIDLEAMHATNSKVMVQVVHKGQKVFQQEMNISSDRFFQSIPLSLKAEETGMQRYTISVTPLMNEISVANNVKDIFIEVIDDRKKVLILAHAPHPDLSAIKQCLENNEHLEVELKLANQFTGQLSAYSVVILHQIPAKANNYSNLTNQLKEAGMPCWYILGGLTDFTQFNKLSLGLTVNVRNTQSNEALAAVNPNFALFSLSDHLQKNLPYLPPLNTPFAQYVTGEGTQILFQQKILNVKTNDPLWLITQQGTLKHAILCGDGLWKWYLAEYAQTEQHELLQELVNKTIQLLSAHANKRKFRVHGDKLLEENETIEFDAELYNDAYELVNTSDVKMEITDKEKKQYTFTFSPLDHAYHLNAGSLPPGDYSYKASTTFDGKQYQANGLFTVAPLDMESLNLVADVNLLNTLASQHNGKMFFPNQLDELEKSLMDNENIRPVAYSDKGFHEWINLKFIFFLLLALLTFEWFVRKFMGGF